MKEVRSKSARSIKILVILSALLALSGMVAIAPADETPPTPVANMFRGTVSVNGEWVTSGTITAHISGEPAGESPEIENGWYYISVEGDASEDNGKEIIFEINGATADQTATWKASSTQPMVLNLSIGSSPASSPLRRPSTGDSSSSGSSGTPGGFTPSTATPAGVDTPVSEVDVTPTPTLTPTPTPAEELREEPTKKRFLPGFEAVFAIAGLLAVGYLVRRRRG